MHDSPVDVLLERHGTTNIVLAVMAEAAIRLEYLRGEIEAERISYGEIAELQSLAQYIDPSDLVLLQWAGVPEQGPVVNCLDRSVYGNLAGRPSHACTRCGGYHDANGQPLRGPCSDPRCNYVSAPGGADHDGPHSWEP